MGQSSGAKMECVSAFMTRHSWRGRLMADFRTPLGVAPETCARNGPVPREAGACRNPRGASAQDVDPRIEHVARTPLGTYELRCGRVGFDLASQAQDLHVDRSV